ncbi:MAG: hypothetical protein GTO46_12670 [Gemmatimonadetes bacterium]|nr:hypothetical protein [Gemmatimonadota bacterium]NIO32442.1 hypothetical protein [Gemmatimonadota bacterium]
MHLWACASSVGARILAAALVFLFSSCSDSTGPDLLLSFTAERFLSPGPSPPVTVEAGDGRITVQGTLSTPCLASVSEIVGEADRSGSELELRVGWVPAGDCVQGVDVFFYEAVLGSLSAGVYRLRVLHVLTGHAAYVALDEDVLVG